MYVARFPGSGEKSRDILYIRLPKPKNIILGDYLCGVQKNCVVTCCAKEVMAWTLVRFWETWRDRMPRFRVEDELTSLLIHESRTDLPCVYS